MLGNFLRKIRAPRIALFIDGPNILRREFKVDLDVIRAEVEKFGRIKQAKVFLNHHAPDKLIEAVMNQGFEPIIGVSGEKADVDVYMAVSAVDAINNENVDIIALLTRDADFLPVVQKAKEKGKEVIVIGQKHGFSKGLQKAADRVVLLK